MPEQFQIALDNAKAQLAQTALNLQSMKEDYQRMLCDAAAQAAQVELAQKTFDRAADLMQRGVTSAQIFDQARTALDAALKQQQSLREQAKVQLAKLGGDPNFTVTEHPTYLQAKAQLDESQRQLDHSTIRAPFDGVVTQVDQLQPGVYLVAATAALTNTGAVALVATDDVWIDANFKETDLTWVKPGENVEISVDTYPGKSWTGRVKTISPASGAEFSILPAQNSSGNWVKVVQRIPVRITVDRKADDPPPARRHEHLRHHRYRTTAGRSPSCGETSSWRRLPHRPAPCPSRNRTMVTVCAMVATLMQALDNTIANVALPYMQGSLSATSDQITWVLTSYVVAAAIFTAPVGWLASNFGRKRLFLVCVVGFTVASALCGMASSLTQIVALSPAAGDVRRGARAAVAGDHARSLSAQSSAARPWRSGAWVSWSGRFSGPTLGGYLTDAYNWRWVFLINVPFGILARLGLTLFMRETPRHAEPQDLTGLGFAVLSLGLAALQLMLDRGEQQDWFHSTEIIVELVLACLGIYLFVVHLFTADNTFIPPRIFKDVNFSAGFPRSCSRSA